MARARVINLKNVSVNSGQNILSQDVKLYSPGRLKITFISNQPGTLFLVLDGVPGIITYNGQTSANLSPNAWYYFEFPIVNAGIPKPTPNQNEEPIESVSINFQFQISSSVSATSATISLNVELETT